MIEPYKYLLQPVAIERDQDGRIVAERVAQVITVFNAEEAARAVIEFEASLAQMTASEDGNQAMVTSD